ncbi:MAG: Na+/H+ antiporter NhaC family protein [Clostridia bacterium]|nr:Na+/H+ antiporter NhaC family protein [Clostridia bacterium]
MEIAPDDLTAPAAEGEGPLVEGEMPAVDEEAPAEDAETEAEEETNRFANTFWALVPPIIAIGLALITKEVYSSLLIGIIFGALLSSSFNFTKAVDNLVNEGFIGAVSGTAGIFVFLVLLGIVVALVNKCGGSYAFGQWAQKHVKSKVGAMLATFVLGCLIFIDDYFNCLTVGSVMRPVTDAKGISRAKLAYIIDATAAPICMIAPISSWAAAVSDFASGTGLNGYELFVKAIPYNFYSLLTIGFVIISTVMKVDFGSMKLHEMNAAKGDLYTTGDRVDNVEDEPNAKGKLIDLALPIVILIIACVAGLLHVGGYFAGGVTLQDAFANTDATVGLPLGAFIATILIVVYLVARRVIKFKEAMECVPKGFIAMVPAILILTFATALKNMTGLLGADTYVHDLMEGAAEGLQSFLPAIIFIVACLLAFATGTSWGTFGILIPIVAAIFEPTDELLYIGMSACLAGAVCGDHCSPISDTTIMASAGAQCNHINHVNTQLPYAIFVAAISFVGFIIAGFVQNIYIVLPLMFVILFLALLLIKVVGKKKA